MGRLSLKKLQVFAVFLEKFVKKLQKFAAVFTDFPGAVSAFPCLTFVTFRPLSCLSWFRAK